MDGLGNWKEFKIDLNDDGNYDTDGELDQDRTHNAANEIYNATAGNAITEDYGTSWADPVHDARGNMTTIPKPTSLSNTYTCTYDAWNRLVEVKSGQTTVAKYEYDGLNRRAKSHVDSQAPAAPDGVDIYRHFFYNAGWQLLETRRTEIENFAPDAMGTAVKIEWQFVWSARYVDAPVLRDRSADLNNGTGNLGFSGSGLEERLYYTTDANMNVTALINTDGTVAERYVYDAYGTPTIYDDDWSTTVSWANSKQNHILYCGYYRDAETGLYHVRNRMYHAQLGRWVQRDPVEYYDGLNLLQYVGSGSESACDPFGLLQYARIGAPQNPTGAASVEVVPDGFDRIIKLIVNGQLKSQVSLAGSPAPFSFRFDYNWLTSGGRNAGSVELKVCNLISGWESHKAGYSVVENRWKTGLDDKVAYALIENAGLHVLTAEAKGEYAAIKPTALSEFMSWEPGAAQWVTNIEINAMAMYNPEAGTGFVNVYGINSPFGNEDTLRLSVATIPSGGQSFQRANSSTESPLEALLNKLFRGEEIPEGTAVVRAGHTVRGKWFVLGSGGKLRAKVSLGIRSGFDAGEGFPRTFEWDLP